MPYNSVFSRVLRALGQDEEIKDTEFMLQDDDDQQRAATKDDDHQQQGATAEAEAVSACQQTNKRKQRSSCWQLTWTEGSPENLVDLSHRTIEVHIARGKKTRGFKSCTRLSSKAVELETHKTVSYNAVASALALAFQHDEQLCHCWFELRASSPAPPAPSSTACSAASSAAVLLAAEKTAPSARKRVASSTAGSVAPSASVTSAAEGADIPAPKRSRRGKGSVASWTAGPAASWAAAPSVAEGTAPSDSKRVRKGRGLVASSTAGTAASSASLASVAKGAASALPKRSGKRKKSKPRRSAGHGRAIRACLRSLRHESYGVLKKAVPHAVVATLVARCKERVSTVLAMHGHSCSEDCSELLKHTALWCKSPAGWAELGEKPFGSMNKRGWIKSVGSGRIFQGTFFSEPALQAVQEHAKPLVAAAMHVSAEDLEWEAEPCAVKPEGSPALPAHIDGEHTSDFQAILSQETTILSLLMSSVIEGGGFKGFACF